MKKETITSLLIVAGVALSGIGGVRIALNLPVSPEEAFRNADPGLFGLSRFSAMYEAEAKNALRAENRKEALALLIPGVIMLLAGFIILGKEGKLSILGQLGETQPKQRE